MNSFEYQMLEQEIENVKSDVDYYIMQIDTLEDEVERLKKIIKKQNEKIKKLEKDFE